MRSNDHEALNSRYHRGAMPEEENAKKFLSQIADRFVGSEKTIILVMGTLYLIHEKSESLDVFKIFKAEVENQLGKKIKAVKSDRGGEYYGRYDGSGRTDLLHSPFFDVKMTVDETVDGYIDRILFTLAPSIEEHLPTGHWRITGRLHKTPPASFPWISTLGFVFLVVEERLVAIDELLEADEVFCTGTAVVVSPVGSITYLGKRVEYGDGVGIVSQQLYSALTSLQMGLSEDKLCWTVVVD
ncbi:hypothetical protein KFK09_027605 [Dendrobium nobile]|uniref:Uncharacterized protein n=1 Tax=Dendrobium nobile TaxID=94219 RepID=A0A8T3AB16_DENNO|nr:hypothetical protein KFK09_027605 [Dendrobium nobile]